MSENVKPTRREQQAARRLMKENEGMKYTQALRRIRAGETPAPDPRLADIPDRVWNGLSI